MRADDDAAMSSALSEAAAWRIELTEMRQETTPAFEAWLANGSNASAWKATQAMWSELDAAAEVPRVRAFRRSALRRRPRRPRSLAVIGGLAAGLGAMVLGLSANQRLDAWKSLSSPQGERRVVDLNDGSRLTLDAGSAVRLRFDRSERRVDLVAGQARFDVAHDKARPFRVHAGDRLVTALGTSFMVDRTAGAVTVTLLQGRVSVAEDPPAWLRPLPHASRPPTFLWPGERVTISRAGSGVGSVQPVALNQATAWQGGRLVFDNEPLAVAVERVSRYSARPVTVADDVAGAHRVSGVFDAGDTTAFVEAVTSYFDLEAVRNADGVALRSRDKNHP